VENWFVFREINI